MRILGERLVVSKVEEDNKRGDFQTVDPLDSFTYKGKIEMIPEEVGTAQNSQFNVLKNASRILPSANVSCPSVPCMSLYKRGKYFFSIFILSLLYYVFKF